jgi:hypothetical protein
MAKKKNSQPAPKENLDITPKKTRKPRANKTSETPVKKTKEKSPKKTTVPDTTAKVKKPLSPKMQAKLTERKRVWAEKLLGKLTRATSRELKKQNVIKDEKELKEFVKTIVLPVFRGLNPRDVKVKDIRELVAESFTTTVASIYYNPIFIPVGDITGIMWADLDDYLDVDLRAVVDSQPLRVDINAGIYGSTGIFNLQDYQYEATQVNEIYEGIREVIDNDSNAEWNGRVMVRKGFTDDGNPDSYFLQFVLSANGAEIEPTETLDESVGFEIPKETQAQRRARLKDVIARKKELASQRRKKSKERSMRLRERPKTKEAPATEVKSEALERQENVKSIMNNQEKLMADAERLFDKGIYNKTEFKARIKEITEQTNLALSKFKRGGEV